MKNILTACIAILAVFILSAATTVSIMTVKPATPKQIIVKSFINEGGSENVAEYVKSNMKQGWILKEVSGANYSQMRSTWIVVMEKY